MEKRGEWILLLVPFLFGTTYALIRIALQEIPASLFVSLRFSAAIVCFLPVVILSRRFRREILHALPSGILLGFVAAGFYLLQTMGLQTVSAPRGAFITASDALFVPVLALFFRDFKPNLADWVSVFVAVVGLYFLLEPSRGGITQGDILILICAVLIALHIHLVQKISRRNFHPLALALIQIVVISVSCAVASAVGGEGKLWTFASVSWKSWAAVLFCGGVVSVGTLSLQAKYQVETSPQRASLIFSLDPLFGSLFSWIFIGEVLRPQAWWGAGFLLFSLVGVRPCVFYVQSWVKSRSAKKAKRLQTLQ